MNCKISSRLLIVCSILFAGTAAQAHPGHGLHGPAFSGLLHPLTGLDHLLAMLAVGLWAAQLGGRARWIVPASFVGCMTVGALLGGAGLAVPFVEPVVVASVFVIGLLLLTAARLPVTAGALLVGTFALFHGHAHGTEAAGAVNFYAYMAGFSLTTALLHAAGIALGSLAVRSAHSSALRWAGAAVAGAAVVLAL